MEVQKVNEENAQHSHQHAVTIKLDCEPIKTKQVTTTANEILKLGSLNPYENYLVKVECGRPGVSFQGKGDEPTVLNDGDEFVAVSTRPTPVS